MVGEHREELAVARRGRRLFPDSPGGFELRALAPLGRTDEVQALIKGDGSLGLSLLAAGELLVHDHLDGSSKVLDRGIMRGQAWLSAMTTDTTSRWIGNVISQLADMLVLRGRVDEARVVLEWALEERGDSQFRREYIGTLGVIAGMQGDRQGALEIAQDLGAQPWTWRSGQAFWQARIAASLGEFDEATALLREAGGEGRSAEAIHFRSPLLWLTLRDHPPFQELIRPKG